MLLEHMGVDFCHSLDSVLQVGEVLAEERLPLKYLSSFYFNKDYSHFTWAQTEAGKASKQSREFKAGRQVGLCLPSMAL